MSADEIEKRDQRERIPREVLEAIKDRWMQQKELRVALPHIPPPTLKAQLERLYRAGQLWRREVEAASLTEFERNTRRGSSTPVYEYRCKFM